MGLRALNDRVDRWFQNHVVVWWIVLATVPGGAYAAAQVLIQDGSPAESLLLGTVFGVIFATITIGVRSMRSSTTS